MHFPFSIFRPDECCYPVLLGNFLNVQSKKRKIFLKKSSYLPHGDKIYLTLERAALVGLQKNCQLFSRSIWGRRRSHHPAVKRLSLASPLGLGSGKLDIRYKEKRVWGEGEIFWDTLYRERGKGGRETDRQSGVSKKRARDTLPWPCMKVGSRLYHTKHLALPLRLATEKDDCSRQDGRIIMKGQNSILCDVIISLKCRINFLTLY